MEPQNFPQTHVQHAKLAALRVAAEKVTANPESFWSQEIGARFLDLAAHAGETTQFDLADDLLAKAVQYGLPPHLRAQEHLVRANNLATEAGVETHAPTRGQLLRMALDHYQKATSTRIASEAHHGIANIYFLKTFDVATEAELYAAAQKALHHAKLAINGGASSWGANQISASALEQLIYSSPTGIECLKHITELEKFCASPTFDEELGKQANLFRAYCHESRSGFVADLDQKVWLLEASLVLINSTASMETLAFQRARAVVTSTTRIYDAIWIHTGTAPDPSRVSQSLDDYLDICHDSTMNDVYGFEILIRKSRLAASVTTRIQLLEEAIEGLQRIVDFGYYPTLARACLGLAMASLACAKGEPFGNRSLLMSAEGEIELAIETDPGYGYLVLFRAALHALQGDSDAAARAIVEYAASDFKPTDSGLDPWYYKEIWHATKFKNACQVLRDNYELYN